MSSRSRLLASVGLPIGVAIVVAGAWLAHAGDLNPPAGAIAPSHKTLTEVEPRRAVNSLAGTALAHHFINQSGSYYLIADVVSVLPGEIGILIDADNVTIDLNGFALIGPGSGAGDGVALNNPRKNLAVHRGTVRNWGADGIDATAATNSQFADLRISNNGGAGLKAGAAASVRDCGLQGNTGEGIVAGNACSIIGNLSQSNGGSGIKATGTNGLIDGNNCGSNNRGIEVTGTGNLIVRNMARLNTTADYAIATGNNYGQLYNDPGAAFVATNPWANFAGCGTGQTSCSGVCTNLQTDPNNCGNCGAVCPPPPNATATCVNGVCQFACNAGFADCNGNPSDGCEINLLSNVNNCNGCGVVCPARPNATVSCVNGACQYACNVGFADCNANMTDGCETNTTNNVNNCGNCGVVCPPRPNSTSICQSGNCNIVCTGSFRNCDGVLANGCEVNILTDINNCGACGAPCILPNANSACNAGVCVITSCTGGFTNCNGIAADGCECPPGHACVGGVCQ